MHYELQSILHSLCVNKIARYQPSSDFMQLIDHTNTATQMRATFLYKCANPHLAIQEHGYWENVRRLVNCYVASGATYNMLQVNPGHRETKQNIDLIVSITFQLPVFDEALAALFTIDAYRRYLLLMKRHDGTTPGIDDPNVRGQFLSVLDVLRAINPDDLTLHRFEADTNDYWLDRIEVLNGESNRMYPNYMEEVTATPLQWAYNKRVMGNPDPQQTVPRSAQFSLCKFLEWANPSEDGLDWTPNF